MIRIFDLTESKQLILTEHAMMVPEISKLVDKFGDDHMLVIRYCYLMTVPDSPYGNLEDEEMEEEVLKDVGGNFSLDDKDIDACLKKLTKLYTTPSSVLHKSAKKSMFHTSNFLSTFIPTSDSDGKLVSEYRQYQMNIGKINDNFKKLDKDVHDEFKIALRGKQRAGRY